MKSKLLLSALLIILIQTLCLQAQEPKSSASDLYLDANSYFFYEDYEEALSLYLQVIKDIPRTANLNYRIGICYLNLPGRRNKAIPFLEEASKNTSKSYRENSIKEDKAPLETYYFLGNAYLTNNQLSKAKNAFSKFRQQTKKESKEFDIPLFDLQTKTIESSAELQHMPVNFLLSNLGPTVNDRFSNFSPTVSYNGQVLAFTSKRKFYQAVYVARKSGQGWGTPLNITAELETDQNLQTLSLNYDGTDLYLYKDDNRDGNIYVSHYRNGRWNPIEPLGPNINTKYWEASACISPDGKTLYFSSNREGGYGELDIYKSDLQPNGTWGPAINLGKDINTPFNETNPKLTASGETLFFSSDGYLGLGGYDIYFSNLTPPNHWSKPENLGYPINTTDDDNDFMPLEDGQYGLIARFDPDSYGEMDLFKVEIFSDRYAREVVLHNQLALRRNRNAKEKLLVIDTLNTQKLALVVPENEDQTEYTNPTLRYKLYFDGKRYDLRDKVAILSSKNVSLQEPNMNMVPKIASIGINNLSESDESAQSANEVSQKINAVDRNLTNLKDSTPYLLDIRYQTDIGLQFKNRMASIFSVPGMPLQTTEIRLSRESLADNPSSQLLKIFRAYGLNISDSLIAKSAELQGVSPHLFMATLLNQTDSGTYTTNDLIKVMATFLDKLIQEQDKLSTASNRSRNIVKETKGSSFINLFNLLRSKASGKLRLMLNSIDPEVNQIESFSQLIDLLHSLDEVDFQSYKSELAQLLSEITIDEFSNLDAQTRSQLVASAEHKNGLRYLTYGVGSAIGIGLLFLLFILFVRRKKSNKQRNSAA